MFGGIHPDLLFHPKVTTNICDNHFKVYFFIPKAVCLLTFRQGFPFFPNSG